MVSFGAQDIVGSEEDDGGLFVGVDSFGSMPWCKDSGVCSFGDSLGAGRTEMEDSGGLDDDGRRTTATAISDILVVPARAGC